jgi:hypothetical protein
MTAAPCLRVLVWHVHAAWSTSFVSGTHDYLVPATADRGPQGRGRPATYHWPDSVREVTPQQLADEPVDVVVLQRDDEIGLVHDWLGRVPGLDVPAVYVEHNTPRGGVLYARHPMAEQSAVPLVHVTHFNNLVWDSGRAPVFVIEHGVPDPGPRWTGEQPRAVAVINEPGRRGRVTGTDLLPVLGEAAPVDLFGIGTDGWRSERDGSGVVVLGQGDHPHDALLAEMARRRVYLHTCRWTSLGLSLIEAMHLGMPVVAVASTEAPDALAESGAVVSSDVDRLVQAVRTFCDDADAAAVAGRRTRDAALARYSLDRFLADWDRVLLEVTR